MLVGHFFWSPLSAVTAYLPAEVDSKVCQGFTFFSIWQDLYQQKKLGQKALTVHNNPVNVNWSFSCHGHIVVELHQCLVYLMKNVKCSCDEVQNLKFIRNLIFLHMVQLYFEGIELDLNV